MDSLDVFSWGNLGLNLVPGVLLWVIQAVVRRNMPKKPNGVYGYRTRRSMASQQAWDYANRRSIDLLALFSWPNMAAAVPCTLYLDLDSAQLILYMAMTIFCVILLALVERDLARGVHERDEKP
ncbi:MAG: SdpI family protein [Flavobacteriales bacterium]|nr:SdpI family protein [Flavobacteriales bacterium]